MPKVPRYDGPQIQARGVGVAAGQRIGFTPNTGIQQFGNALQQAGGQVLNQAMREQQYADDLRVEEAVNQLRERQLDLTMGEQNGFTNVRGRNVLSDADENGQGLAERYRPRFQGVAAEIEGGLANEYQKQAFRQYAARTGREFESGLLRHQKQEIDQWRRGVVEGVIATETQNAAKNWNNLDEINLSRGRIDLNLERMRREEGWGAEETLKMRQSALTKLHAGVIDQMVANRNLAAAESYMQQYGDEIDAAQLTRARNLVMAEKADQYAFAAAQNATSNLAARAEPDDFQRVQNIMMETGPDGELIQAVAGQESRGRQFNDDGSVVTSPKGAIGIMQVMPATGPEAARLAGLPWDEKRFKSDPEYNRALGTAYLAAQLRKYGGDVAKALAAYNAGPGALDKALAEAKKDGKPENWLAYLPAETRKYVPAILNKYQSGGGRPREQTFEEIDAQLRRDPVLANDPGAYQKARTFAKQQFDDARAAKKIRQEEAEGAVYQALVDNGGDFQRLPAAMRAGIDPSKLPAVMTFADKMRKGQDTVTDPVLYQKLTQNPEILKGMTDAQMYALRPHLSEGDWRHFLNEQAKARGVSTTGKDSPMDLDSAGINRVLNNRLEILGINPNPPAKETEDNARVGAIRRFVNDEIGREQQRMGRKLNDAETQQVVDRLFAQNVTFRNTFAGIETGKQTMSLLGMKYGDIPDDVVKGIKDAYERAGQPKPTEAQVMQAYWTMKFRAPSVVGSAKAPPPPKPLPVPK